MPRCSRLGCCNHKTNIAARQRDFPFDFYGNEKPAAPFGTKMRSRGVPRGRPDRRIGPFRPAARHFRQPRHAPGAGVVSGRTSPAPRTIRSPVAKAGLTPRVSAAVGGGVARLPMSSVWRRHVVSGVVTPVVTMSSEVVKSRHCRTVTALKSNDTRSGHGAAVVICHHLSSSVIVDGFSPPPRSLRATPCRAVSLAHHSFRNPPTSGA